VENRTTINVLGSQIAVIPGPIDWFTKSLTEFNYFGIYVLWNKVTTKCYVGSSQEIGGRVKGHYKDLCNQVHHSVKLQRSWNIHGAQNFEFHVLEYSNEDLRIEVETGWITRLDSYKNGYNMTPRADVIVAHTPEMRRASSERLDRLREEGKLYTEVWREKTLKNLEERNKSDKQKQAVVASWTDERKAEQAKKNVEHNRSEQMRAIASQNGKRMYDTPEHKAEMVERNKSEEHRASVRSSWNTDRKSVQGGILRQLHLDGKIDYKKCIETRKLNETEEVRQRRSGAQKGKVPSQEKRNKISNSLRLYHKNLREQRNLLAEALLSSN